MTKVKSLVSRTRLIGASLLIPLLVLAIWSVNTRTTSAQGGFESAIFTVSPKSGNFPNSTVPGTVFQTEGDITFVNERGQSLPGDDGSVGQFYRSGVVLPSGFSQVTDIYVLRGSNGFITATGLLRSAVVGNIEKADLLAVTGGVGTFRGVSGEAQIITTDTTTGKFTVRLEEGARRGQFFFNQIGE